MGCPHVRCFPRTFCSWPCLLRQVGTVLGSPYDYVVAGLTYANPGSRQEYPVRILDSAERVTRRQKIKFLKVLWSHHSEREATWEREDRLNAEYPTFLPQTSESWDEILLSGGELSEPFVR